MTNTPPLIVYTALTQMGVLTGSGGWQMSWNRMPVGPGNDNFILVSGTTGIIQGTVIDKQANLVMDDDLKGIQIRTRSKDFNSGWGKLEQIRLLLLQIRRQSLVVNSVTTLLHMFQMVGQIIPMGQEETEKREHFSSNWLFSVEEL